MQDSSQDVRGRSRSNSEMAGLWSARLSPPKRRVWWFAFVGLHCICLGYYATIARCYSNLPGSMLDNWLSFYRLGLGSEHYHVVVIVHGCFAGIHFFYFVWMVGWSLKKRKLVFSIVGRSTKTERLSHGVIGSFRAFYSKFSVGGPFFDVLLLIREAVETALQTSQAYRMSLLLSRRWINHGYVVLLVLNCWSTTLVHHVFHIHTASRRFWALTCDCVLDLVTSVGITTALLLIYSSEFNFEKGGYPTYNWYEDVWVVQVMSEFQILMVASWGDFAMRVFFALGLIANMNNIKKLLSARTLSSTKTLRTSRSKANVGIATIVPLNPNLPDVKSAYNDNRAKVWTRWESWFTRILFFAWGTLILVVHLYAGSMPTYPQCEMPIKPWFSSRPACSLLYLDCYAFELSGTKDEVIAHWGLFDPATVASLVIRHCPALEMPSTLTEFSRLRALKLYNSTITSWQEDAAISQRHHPNLLMLFLARVNMTNGDLPAGLYRELLPQTLRDIEFCVTNLRSLPEELDLTWPHFATIYLEAGNLTEIPQSLAQLASFDLSLALNPIATISTSILEGNDGYLHFGGTLISELPESVENVSPNLKIRLDNTNISFFWNWIDPMVANANGGDGDGVPTLLAPNTPYCTDLERIYGGEQTSFSAPQHEGQSLLLSDASVENWPTLERTVSCELWPATYFPIESEDEHSRIKSD